MRSADLPGLRGFNGGCGSFRFCFRQRRQPSLDLRYLRLRFRDQAFASPICLQLSFAGVLARRDVALRPFGARVFAKAFERSFRNRVPDVVHQALVVRDIDFRQQHRAERLARPHEVM